MKIYASRKSILDKLIGTDIWFKYITSYYPYDVKWINLVAANPRMYVGYYVTEQALKNTPETLERRGETYYLCTSLGPQGYRVKHYKHLLEEAAKTGEVMTTEELWGFTKEELEEYKRNRQLADEEE